MSVMVSCFAQEVGKARRYHQAWQQQRKKFWVSVDRVCYELGVIKIYNADQSGTCFEYLPKLTVSRKGEKTSGWKTQAAITGTFLGNSDGNQYPPFYILMTPL